MCLLFNSLQNNKRIDLNNPIIYNIMEQEQVNISDEVINKIKSDYNNDLNKEKVEEKPKSKKKEINFQEMPQGTNEILNQNQINQQIVDHFTKQTPIAMPTETNPNASHLSLILNPNLRDLEMMIRGLESVRQWNPITQREEVVLRRIENHPLNDYGINKIMELLRIWSSSELKLSRRTPKDAIQSAQQIGKDARRLIYKNLKEFGMDNQVKMRSAKTYGLAIFEFTYSALTRSIAGMENDSSRPTEFSVQSNMLDNANQIPVLTKHQKENLKN